MYFKLLQDMLYPLHVYDLESGASAAELYAEGEQLDRVLDALEELEREALPSTAEGYGLERYEDILPYLDGSGSRESRRAAIEALLRIDWCSFTLEALRGCIAGCGVAVEIEESAVPETVEVSFPGVRGEPENFGEIKRRLEQILPCHLDILYLYEFIIWQELEDWFGSWDELEALNWGQLQVYREV